MSEYSEHLDRFLVLDLLPPIFSRTGQALDLSLKMDLMLAAEVTSSEVNCPSRCEGDRKTGEPQERDKDDKRTFFSGIETLRWDSLELLSLLFPELGRKPVIKLSKFVQELTLQPEKYVFQKNEPNGNPTSVITANNVSTHNKRTNFVPRKLSTTLVPPHEVDDTIVSALTNIKSNCFDSSSGYIDTSSWDTDFYEEKEQPQTHEQDKKKVSNGSRGETRMQVPSTTHMMTHSKGSGNTAMALTRYYP
uniref:Uncharacterized protein n=1 Tax=Timema bartmani TaxID=61472 RepID=A0A7R9EN05_9NEOP|nr:unnamed protein product [Timema bartmani]